MEPRLKRNNIVLAAKAILLHFICWKISNHNLLS